MSYLSKGRGAFKIVSLMQLIREGGFFGYWIERDAFYLRGRMITMSRMKKVELEAPTVSPVSLMGKIKQTLFE